MSATEVTALPEVEKKEVKIKPDRPDEDLYRATEAKLKKEHEEALTKHKAIHEKISAILNGGSKGGPQTPAQVKQSELKAELNTIKATQSSKKSSKLDLIKRRDQLQKSIEEKIKAQKDARGKISYKSPEDIDHAIAQLEKQVDAGTLKLVEERKTLADISALRKQKKQFSGFEDSQAVIDKERAALTDVRKELDDPEQRALSDRYSEIQKELDAYKAENDAAYQSRNTLFDERTRLNTVQQDKFHAWKSYKDSHFAAKKAYRDYEQEAWKIKEARRREEQDAYMKEKRRRVAEARMEEASNKAYAEEIRTCESLIGHFDPASAVKKQEVTVRELAAQPSRTVTEAPKGTRLATKDDREEDYFAGTGKKGKGKKGRGKVAAAASEDSSAPATPPVGKWSLQMGVLEQLAKVDVHPPMAQEDVAATLEKLRTKLAFYKDNQDRVTNENIAKAQAEIDKLEADGSSPKTTTTATSTVVDTAKSTATAVVDAVTSATESLGLTSAEEEKTAV